MTEALVNLSDHIDPTEHLRRAAESVVGPVFTEGNTLDVLRNGDEIFPAMLDAIAQAQRSIEFVTFVYWTGPIARQFANSLTERARAGVRVRVLLDGFGSRPMDPALVEQLKEAGAEVEVFRPLARLKFWETDHRTHRKILICDDEVGFTGGVGIASEWQGNARSPDEWRDTHFRIKGPAVRGLKAAFLADWRDTGHAIDAHDISVPTPDVDGNVLLGVVDGSAHIGFNPAERLMEGVIAAAQRSILIQSPYFNPSDGLIDLLVDARNRGVEIDVLIPGPHIDKRVSRVVAADRSDHLLDAGVRMWEYQPTMMHVKAIIVDNAAAVVGSVNFNRRSVEKDEEVALVAIDQGIAAELTAHFREDLRKSNPVKAPADLIGTFGKLVAPALRLVQREF